MKAIDFYLDFASPYAYLAFEQLPQTLQGLSYTVRYQPVLLGALFQHHGHQGPAAIAPKHAWIMRHTRWQAGELGVPLQWPAVHPFPPLGLLRLAWACARQGTPNRWVCEQILHHVWRGGGAPADDPARLAALTATLNPAQDPGSPAVKAQLRAATDAAAAAGVFGVPAFGVDGRLFWGLEALPMLRAHLQGDARLAAVWDAPAGTG
ncbi:MAG: 2-hydroxychromene-2-carboxylate isomerase [Pseudomonadota bacterium]|nr:2-hydroxychromene-2-carboxylate isomerase [Pseudomonadota bacterium]